MKKQALKKYLLVLNLFLVIVFLGFTKNVRGEEVAKLLDINLKNATLYDYDTKENVDFTSDKDVYLIKQNSSGISSLTIKNVSDGASYTINGEEKSSVDIDYSKFLSKITVKSGDNTKNYYFIYQKSDGTIPLIQKSSENESHVKIAEDMLKTWKNREDSDKKNMYRLPYWSLFMSKATDIDLSDGYVSDPEKDTYSQATVYSRNILQLIMLGYNPYDFGESHMNLVEGLRSLESKETKLYGAWGNNVWTLMALRACGEEIPYELVDYVRTSDLYNLGMGTDIAGWALSALKGLIPESEILKAAVTLKEKQSTTGHWGNMDSDGCIITGFVGAGINLEYLNFNNNDILQLMSDSWLEQLNKQLSESNPNHEMFKDMIIALGDVIHGNNVWQRYILDENKWDKLIQEATVLSVKYPNNLGLSSALKQAKSDKEKIGTGKSYFTLYDEVAKLNTSYQEKVHFGIKYDGLIEPIEGKHYYVKITENETENETHGWHQKVGFFVSKKECPLNQYGTICLVDKDDINYDDYTFEYMYWDASRTTDPTKVYGKDIKVKILCFVENDNWIDDDDQANYTANCKVVNWGPISLDGTKPVLALSLDKNAYDENNSLNLNVTGKDKIFAKASDKASGICNILYQTNDGEWVTVYDAAKDDKIDVDNDCGLLEKEVEIPVSSDATTMNVKVIDVAGLETISSVSLTRNPAFSSEPITKLIKESISDLTWNILFQGTEVQSVNNGETTLEASSYDVNIEAGTLTLKKDYLSTLEKGEHLITINFTKNGEPIEAKLTAKLIIKGNTEFSQEVVNAINAIGVVDLTKEEKIKEARKAYDELTSEQKALVSAETLKVLTDAETTLETLKVEAKKAEEEKAKAEADKKVANEVSSKINAIGVVDLTKEEAIKEARKAYDELTSEQKALISAETLKVLTDAEKAFKTLKEKSEQSIGQVHVIIENSTYSKSKGAKWDGILVDTWVDLKEDSTMMNCIKRVLEDKGYTQTGADQGYISEINGLAQYDGGTYSGWMGTLNDWFTNAGFDNYTVRNKELQSGDEIHVMYSCVGLGADLGADWNDKNTSLIGLAFSTGKLDKSFTSDTKDYILSVSKKLQELLFHQQLIIKTLR
ncbi:cell surface protein [Lachnospiraceae bacterium TWA4]|nr:cell surface protein [Lachnospiraceae bacterium TWA4]